MNNVIIAQKCSKVKKERALFYLLALLWCDASLRLATAPALVRNKKVNFFVHSLRLVPETGLEPAHQMAYAPKAYVYTNFTIRAWVYYIILWAESAIMGT